MQRRTFLGAMAGAALAAPARKPNFILVLIDDLGWKDFSVTGSTIHPTPNIDRMAAEGVRFTNAYAACPVCSPTRASIMTGKYPARLHLTDWIPGRKPIPYQRVLPPEFNQQLPLNEVTIAETLQPLGYKTASIGKWHLGGDGFLPTNQGFDRNIAGTEKGSPPKYLGPFELPNLKVGEGQELTERLADEAERFLDENRANPFFLYLPEYTVHIPLGARAEMAKKYEGKTPQPLYAAMVETVDLTIARLRRKLAELKIDDNTVILLTSDNGGLRHEGKNPKPVADTSPLRAGKGHLYEGGVRVPLIIHAPGRMKPGTVVETPVASVDFLPTFADMAGAKPGPVDGRSLAGVLKGGSLKRDALYWHYPHYSNQGGEPGGAVREGDWKLIEFYTDNRQELFHLKEDPGEQRNLILKEPARAAKLHAKLKAWRAEVKADMPKVNPGYDPARADMGLFGAEKPTPAVPR